MVLLRRMFTTLLLGALGTSAFGSALIPPLTGELEGKLSLPALPDMPPMAWKLQITSTESNRRKAEFSMAAQGAKVRLLADVDRTTGEGKWALAEADVDPAIWFATIAPKLVTSLSDVKAEGRVRVTGEGTVTRLGALQGNVRFDWIDGALRNTKQGWRLEGVSLSGQLTGDLAKLATAQCTGEWKLGVKTIATNRFGARNLEIDGILDRAHLITLQSARLELAGGNVTIDPGKIYLLPTVVDLTLHVDRVGLQDLVALLPGSLADARGRIDGEVRLGWSQATGLRVGEGHFALRDDEMATLQLAPQPGILTAQFPERLKFLPAWTGPVGRWMAPVNPVYGDARDIEMGKTSLQIVAFDLKLMPKGDALGRTGMVTVSTRAIQPQSLVKLVTFNIGLDGSVEKLLQLGKGNFSSIKTEVGPVKE